MDHIQHIFNNKNPQKKSELQNPSSKLYDGYHKYDQQVAEAYDSSREIERHWHKEDHFINDYLLNKRINSLLDLPVGTGRFFRHYTGVCNLTGVDISEEMLVEARKKCQMLPPSVEVRLQRGDVLDLAYSDMSFDVAIVFRLFHLIPECLLDQAINELCRVVRKDLIVQTYVPLKLHGYCLSKYHIILEKIRSIFRNRTIPPLLTTAPNRPWLDIQAFYHHQVLFNSIFKSNGFYPSESRLLDIYGNCEVRATVYTRKSYKTA